MLENFDIPSIIFGFWTGAVFLTFFWLLFGVDKDDEDVKFCPRCGHNVPLIDDGETCAVCKLVL